MKEIQLNRGRVALVDDDDYEKLVKFRWITTSGGYVVTSKSVCNRTVNTLMHRMIMGCSRGDGLIIDHKDKNPLNNQKSNLRLCNKSQNAANANKRESASKYIGVTWVKREKIWVAQITKNYQNYYLGRYKNEEDAGLAYNKKAIELHGEFANLNKITA